MITTTLASHTNIQSIHELHTLDLSECEIAPLSPLQESAIDLRRRGFNVFPIPYGKKEPFRGTLLKRLFNTRLHFCVDGIGSCSHDLRTASFADLFLGPKNIAVMCGRTSNNLVALDCDTEAAYKRIEGELEKRALPYWAFTSHRGGSFLLRVLEGETANISKDLSCIDDVEVWGNSHYVILPPSVHPMGTVYMWRGDTEPQFHFASPYETLPAVSITSLEWLNVSLLKGRKVSGVHPEMFGLPDKYSVLSNRNREMLARGTQEGERNTRLTALAYDLAGCGFKRAEIDADFLQSACQCTPPYPQHQAQAILKSAYARERKPAK